jgi:predicted Zn-dependent peptidase
MNRPSIRPTTHIDVPSAPSRTLPNGVKLYVVECSEQEVVRFSFVFRAGSASQSVPFSASASANLMSEGTARHSALEIAELLDFHGSNFEVAMDRDWAVLNFVSLSKFFPQTLSVAREMLLEPSFADDEVAIYREKRKQRLALERSKVGMRARELFARALFGGAHPYGLFHDEALYDSLTREQIVDFWRRHYVAENCFVVCSGRVGDDEIAALSALAGDIPSGGAVSEPLFPAPESSPRVFAPHDGAVQSAIRMGTLLFPRTHPDFAAMQVLTTVLGGYFGSRLVHNLREERGYTYGVFATMVNLQHAGYMAVATEVAAAATDDSIAQIKHEIERLRREMVPADELEMVKNIMTGEVMRILDGPIGIADVTIENVCNGVDNRYNSQWLSEIRSVTPERLQALAVKYLDPEKLTTVVVGPPDALD